MIGTSKMLYTLTKIRSNIGFFTLIQRFLNSLNAAVSGLAEDSVYCGNAHVLSHLVRGILLCCITDCFINGYFS